MNNEYLTFVTKSESGGYTNEYFVCGDKCIPYSKVCDLVFDCLDKSDEMKCTNHFKCQSDIILIPRIKQCDGRMDCGDLSDECNPSCEDLTMITNDLLVYRNTITICKHLCVTRKYKEFIHKFQLKLTKIYQQLSGPILLVCIGDFLVGGYLLAISATDVYYGSSYCRITVVSVCHDRTQPEAGNRDIENE